MITPGESEQIQNGLYLPYSPSSGKSWEQEVQMKVQCGLSSLSWNSSYAGDPKLWVTFSKCRYLHAANEPGHMATDWQTDIKRIRNTNS